MPVPAVNAMCAPPRTSSHKSARRWTARLTSLGAGQPLLQLTRRTLRHRLQDARSRSRSCPLWLRHAHVGTQAAHACLYTQGGFTSTYNRHQTLAARTCFCSAPATCSANTMRPLGGGSCRADACALSLTSLSARVCVCASLKPGQYGLRPDAAAATHIPCRMRRRTSP
jgi:hypothetical protein